MKPLYADFMEQFEHMDKVHVLDGQGGVVTTWSPGAVFWAAVVLDTSSAVMAAGAAGAKNVYRVTVDPAVTLDFHDVFRRVSDGQVFRVTSNSDDKKTPERATFRMSCCTAEEWVIPG